MSTIIRLEIKNLAETISEQTESLMQIEGELPQIEIDILKDNLKKMYEALMVANKKEKVRTIDTPVHTTATRVLDSEFKMEEITQTVENSMVDVVSDILNQDNRGFEMVEKQSPTFINEAPVETFQEVQIASSIIIESAQEELTQDNKTDELPLSSVNNNPMITFVAVEEPDLNLFAEIKPAVEEIAKPITASTPALDVLKGKAIESLRKAIGINDKFQFINELFEGNMAHYNRTIEAIDLAGNKAFAMEIVNNLKSELQWDIEENSYVQFLNYISRRYQS